MKHGLIGLKVDHTYSVNKVERVEKYLKIEMRSVIKVREREYNCDCLNEINKTQQQRDQDFVGGK